MMMASVSLRALLLAGFCSALLFVSGHAACTTAESCFDGNVCTSETCNKATGNCVRTNNTFTCSDGNLCTSGDVCRGGVCRGTAITCPEDNNVCTTASCNPSTGCGFVFNTVSCNDNNANTINDRCSNGVCKGTAVTTTCPEDNNVCTTATFNSNTGSCGFVFNTVSCNDNNPCTLDDRCSNGVCKGTQKDCAEGNVCTDEYCDSKTGQCVYTFNTVACNDNNPATTNDRCRSGVCVGTSTTTCPEDNNVCTTASYNPSTGSCGFVFNTASCNDNNPCTLDDRCSNGVCKGTQKNCAEGNVCTDEYCDINTGMCMYTNNTVGCSDGNPCTANDRCSGGVCVGGATPSCPEDNNVCTTAVCNPSTGGCSFTMNTGTPCNDNNAATFNDTCSNGVCLGTTVSCPEDSDPCTTAAFNVTAGVCGFVFNTAPCDDSNPCTLEDRCRSGVCFGVNRTCSDGNVCTDDTCDTGTGNCTFTNNAANCSDGNFCTENDVCSGGVCTAGSTVVCPEDNNTCTEAVCAPSFGCGFTLLTGSCDDNNLCTDNDTCVRGVCRGITKNCAEGNICTDEFCEPQTGQCIYINNNISCSDSDPCTINDRCSSGICTGGGQRACQTTNPCATATCVPGVGCVTSNLPTGTACNDNNAGTTNDTCTNGVCFGTSISCPEDGNVCTTAAFNPSTGSCGFVFNTASCNDNNPCTLEDRCSNGVCTGTPKNCAEGNVCTDEYCEAGTGRCIYTNNTVACNDGNANTINDRCSGGVCKGTSTTTTCPEDNNVCTTASFNTKTGSCGFVFNTVSCNDNNPCTLDDRCSNGVCKGTQKNCAEGNVCTDEYCDAKTGQCVYTFNTVACSDGNSCTTNDRCRSGVCVGGTNVCP